MSQWIVTDFQRPATDLVTALGEMPTGILGDCMNRLQSMHSSVKAIQPGRRVCGPAFTVQSMETSNWGGHQALELSRPGDVLVIAARNSQMGSVWGHIMTFAAKKKGLGGAVIDGCIRDLDENRADDFPLFCRGVCPGGPHKGWKDNINVTVSCAGVAVAPGDIIVGDDDGVVVIPQHYSHEVLKEAQTRLEMEKEWYRRLEDGASTLDLLGLDRVEPGEEQ
jgi:4-hydroxy-4-methyl-2-oxoglutarate aldolase